MAKKQKPRKYYPRPEGRTDVFARLDSDVVSKLDAMVEAMTPATSRSAVIAMLVEQYVAERWSEHEKKHRKR